MSVRESFVASQLRSFGYATVMQKMDERPQMVGSIGKTKKKKTY